MSDINGTENTGEITIENSSGENDGDLSSNQRISKWSEQWWATIARPGVRRCKAHRKNGNRCRRACMEGQNVCGTYGGRAPQNIRKARERLAEAADRMARELLKMAIDPSVADAVKLSAIKDALDRGGVSVKSVATVEITTRPYEEIFDSIEMTTGSRAQYRRSQGISDDSDTPPALADHAVELPALPLLILFRPSTWNFLTTSQAMSYVRGDQ